MAMPRVQLKSHNLVPEAGSPGVRYGADSAWAHEIEERRAPVTPPVAATARH